MTNRTPYQPLSAKLMNVLAFIDTKGTATVGEVVSRFPLAVNINASLHKLVSIKFLTKSGKLPRQFKVVEGWRSKADSYVADSTQDRLDRLNNKPILDNALQYDTLSLQRYWR